MLLKILIFVNFSALCTTEACHDLWYNQCTDNTECCSGFCFKGEDNGWQEGVCKSRNTEEKPVTETKSPPSASNCHKLWYNHCTDDSECCSGFCFRGEDNGWQEGVCKSRNA